MQKLLNYMLCYLLNGHLSACAFILRSESLLLSYESWTISNFFFSEVQCTGIYVGLYSFEVVLCRVIHIDRSIWIFLHPVWPAQLFNDAALFSVSISGFLIKKEYIWIYVWDLKFIPLINDSVCLCANIMLCLFIYLYNIF